MGNMTLSVSPELEKKMEKHPEIRWSNVARQAFEKKIEELEWMDKMLKKSELAESDAEKIGNDIKKQVWHRFWSWTPIGLLPH